MSGLSFFPRKQNNHSFIRRFNVGDFYFRNRVVRPKRDGIATDDFHLNNSAPVIFFRKISSGVWVVGQRADELHNTFTLRSQTWRDGQGLLVDEDRVSPHEV